MDENKLSNILTFTSYLQDIILVNEINYIKEISLKKHNQLQKIKC